MRQVNLVKNGGKDMVEVMTDKQYDGILQMIGMILEGCKDLNEAKKKIEELREGKKEKEK
jgi:predicted ArsR family transcriptional regulator